MIDTLLNLWSHLNHSPLLGICLTLGLYIGSDYLYQRFGQNPLLNPVLISICGVCLTLWATGTAYETYFNGAQFIHFLLGPATVALAIPLYKNLHLIKAAFLPLCISILFGSLFAITSGVGIAWALGGSKVTLLSLAPKSVTTPVAMGIAEIIGGIPSLSAVLVILCGITGAVLGGAVLTLCRVKDRKARGLAVGMASHGIGTARKLSLDETSGAFAGLGMGLNALVTAIILSLTYIFWLS